MAASWSRCAYLTFPTPNEPLESISRFVLVIFPIFIGWALLLGRRPRLTRATIATSAVLLSVLGGLWAMWAWTA